MFKKKKQSIAGVGRQRLAITPSGRSSAVFSYHAGRAARPQAGNVGRSVAEQQAAAAPGAAAARQRSRQHRLRRALTVGGFISVAIFLLSNLYISPSPQLVLNNSSAKLFLRSQATYTQAMHNAFTASLGDRTKLTINTEGVAKRLATQFPELGQVSVIIPVFGHQPQVVAHGAVPALIMTTGAQSYVLDTTGHALVATAEAPSVAKLGLATVNDQSGLSVQIGHVALPSSTIAFITEVVGQLKANHFTVASLWLPAGASELDVKVDGAGYVVKFNVRGDARAEAGTYVAVKQQLGRTGKSVSIYIDVRVDGRAYYK